MGSVLNRTTLELRESVDVNDFNSAEWVYNPDLGLVWGLNKDYWKLEGDNLKRKSPEEIAAVDAAKLEVARKTWLARVDAEASRRIVEGKGVEYPPGSGTYVSASLNAQVKWLGFYALADEWGSMGLPFPFPVRTKDDLGYVLVHNAAEIKAIFKLLALYVASGLGAVESTKIALNGATTHQELDAIATAYLESVP